MEAFDKKAAADKAAAQADINRKVEELLLFEQTERIANTQVQGLIEKDNNLGLMI